LRQLFEPLLKRVFAKMLLSLLEHATIYDEFHSINHHHLDFGEVYLLDKNLVLGQN
jgi:hypothetical protein